MSFHSFVWSIWSFFLSYFLPILPSIYISFFLSSGDNYHESFVSANQTFFECVIPHLKHDDVVWVHDYHLMLLPKLLREAELKISIVFYLHIPFPTSQIFRALPSANELLQVELELQFQWSVPIRLSIHVCARASVYVIKIHLHLHFMYIHTFIYACMYMRACVFMCMWVYVSVCVYIIAISVCALHLYLWSSFFQTIFIESSLHPSQPCPVTLRLSCTTSYTTSHTTFHYSTLPLTLPLAVNDMCWCCWLPRLRPCPPLPQCY